MIHSLDLELIGVNETFLHDNGKNLLGLNMVANNQNYVKTDQLEAHAGVALYSCIENDHCNIRELPFGAGLL